MHCEPHEEKRNHYIITKIYCSLLDFIYKTNANVWDFIVK